MDQITQYLRLQNNINKRTELLETFEWGDEFITQFINCVKENDINLTTEEIDIISSAIGDEKLYSIQRKTTILTYPAPFPMFDFEYDSDEIIKPYEKNLRPGDKA